MYAWIDRSDVVGLTTTATTFSGHGRNELHSDRFGPGSPDTFMDTGLASNFYQVMA
jgi:hypothetical protein